MIARVIIDIKSEHVNQLYDYIVPQHLEGILERGMRVKVPFNTFIRVGYVMEILNESPEATKTILDVIEPAPIIDDEQFKLMDYLKTQNIHLQYGFLEMVVPKEKLILYQKTVTILDRKGIPDAWKNKKNTWILTNTKETHLIRRLKEKGVIHVSTRIKTRERTKQVTQYRFNPNHQYHRFHLYEEGRSLPKEGVFSKQALLDLGLTESHINTLVKHGVFIKKERAILREVFVNDGNPLYKTHWDHHQEACLDGLKDRVNDHRVVLVQSNHPYDRMELYIRLMEHVIHNGQQVLFLVPEIAWIEPVFQALNARFDRVGIYHSMATSGQRFDQLKSLIHHDIDILIGTRVASFLTFDKLGLIIVDHEHDPSYRQTEGMVYDARSIMRIRALHHQIPLLLGSHTPSIETMYEAQNQAMDTVQLSDSLQELPTIKIVNMKEDMKQGNTSIVSNALKEAILKRLRAKEKVMLLLQRKGYASMVICKTCGFVPKCPSCDRTLTYYQEKNSLRCHTCGYESPMIKTCDQGHENHMVPMGYGLDYLNKTLSKQFPDARILQMDRQLIKSKGAHEVVLKAFEKDVYDILIGTEMAFRGPFVRGVTLMGILNSDQMLHLPSFQANEKAYLIFNKMLHMLDPKRSSTLVIQGYHPNHYVIQSLGKPYQTYYEETLYQRKIGRYAPFYQTAQILFEGLSYLKTYQLAFSVKKQLEALSIDAYGPSPANPKKIHEHYRFILTLKYQQASNEPIFSIIETLEKSAIRVRFYPHLDSL